MTEAKAVGTLLIAGALCLACVEKRSRIPRERLSGVLESVERNVRITTRWTTCVACRRMLPTFALGERGDPWESRS